MNEKQDVPIKFDWVSARAECSLAQVFKTLELGVLADVDEINKRILPGVQIKFRVASHGIRFSVICEFGGIPSSTLDFYMQGNEIVVKNESAILFRATITLNDAGRCLLKIGDQAFEEWQVRRKALEDILFNKDLGAYL